MRQQSYLVRKGARYHFRRRLACDYICSHSISVSLNTADPAEARRLARRLAVKWDEIAMYAGQVHERGTLTLKEQEALFRSGLQEELAHATRHLTAPIGAEEAPSALHKIMAAAYSVVSRVPASADRIGSECIDAEVDGDWTPGELDLLRKVLALWVTPGTIGDHDARQALLSLGAPTNAATAGEARSHLLQGRAEAHRRAALLGQASTALSPRDILSLVSEGFVAPVPQRSLMGSPQIGEPNPVTGGGPAADDAACIYLQTTTLRFSEVMHEVLEKAAAKRRWKPDKGQRERIAATFASITGDKILSDYRSNDIDDYLQAMRRIPKDFRFGKLHQHGALAQPFDLAQFPKKVERPKQRSDRTINRDLCVLNVIADGLAKTHWRVRYGRESEMDFLAEFKPIEDDPADPKRVPWTPEHLRVMYSLPLFTGGGGVATV